MIDAVAPLTESVDEEFLDLACADDDWVRAEFDAIIAASWPEPEVSGRLPGRRHDETDGGGDFGAPLPVGPGLRCGDDLTVVAVGDDPVRYRAPPR